jgi:glycosyltransferase involved in cell wall biosynthesis
VTRVSVVLPCLNEVDSVGLCVREALDALSLAGIPGEVVVVDNGSLDGSARVAEAAGARVIFESRPGYGRALQTGFKAATGDVVVMADADFTYDLRKVPDLVLPILSGQADLVIGSRLDGANRRTMPILHRFAGTPMLTFLIARACGGLKIKDSQSGFRAFRRNAILGLGLEANGMELTSDMLIRAAHADLRMVEVPTGYRSRIGRSKLRTLRDGWRNLQIILLLAPHLFLFGPGALILLIGLLLTATAFVSPSGFQLGSLHWQPVFFSSIALVLGVQSLLVGSLLAHYSSMVPARVRERFRFVGSPSFASRCVTGGVLAIAGGLGLDAYLTASWLWGWRAPVWGHAAASLAQSLIIAGGTMASFGFLRRLAVRGVSGERLLAGSLSRNSTLNDMFEADRERAGSGGEGD